MTNFLEGRQVVSRSGASTSRATGHLPSLGSAAPTAGVPALMAPAPAAPREQHEKKIETVERDGVIQCIIVTCGCGERIEVHCGY